MLSFTVLQGSRFVFRHQSVPLYQKRTVKVCSRSSWADRIEPGLKEFEGIDDFEAAEIRLQNLLDSPEQNSLENRRQQDAQRAVIVERTSRSLVGCFALTLLGAYVCQLLGHPLSGSDSLTWSDRGAHLACGIAIASPIAMLKWLSWSDEVHGELPSIDHYHRLYRESVADPLLALEPVQAAVYFLAEIIQLSTTRIVALQTCLLVPLIAYSHRLQDLGWWVPDSLPTVAAVLLTAATGGLVHFLNYSPAPEQYEAVQEAVDNSDKYYGLMIGSFGQRSRDASKMSDAFKETAKAWLMDSVVSALLTASFASLEIFLICGLWQGTQDLSAAIPAALVMYGADVAGAYKDLKSQQSQS